MLHVRICAGAVRKGRPYRDQTGSVLPLGATVFISQPNKPTLFDDA